MPRMGQLSEGQIEQEIQNLGLTKGLRLTPQTIDEIVASAEDFYWHVPGTTMVVCALRLTTGYVVIGEAACIEPENFDYNLGCKIARDKARDKLWALEGYLLANIREAVT
jgi:hypothetical protein